MTAKKIHKVPGESGLVMMGEEYLEELLERAAVKAVAHYINQDQNWVTPSQLRERLGGAKVITNNTIVQLCKKYPHVVGTRTVRKILIDEQKFRELLIHVSYRKLHKVKTSVADELEQNGE